MLKDDLNLENIFNVLNNYVNFFFIVTICGTCNLVPVYATLADNDKGLDVQQKKNSQYNDGVSDPSVNLLSTDLRNSPFIILCIFVISYDVKVTPSSCVCRGPTAVFKCWANVLYLGPYLSHTWADIISCLLHGDRYLWNLILSESDVFKDLRNDRIKQL